MGGKLEKKIIISLYRCNLFSPFHSPLCLQHQDFNTSTLNNPSLIYRIQMEPKVGNIASSGINHLDCSLEICCINNRTQLR